MEVLDGAAVGRGEGHVRVLGGRPPVADQREGGPCAAQLAAVLPAAPLAESRVRRHGGVERVRGVDVRHPDPQVVDVAAAAHVAVDHGLGAVAGGVAQEAAVVAGRVLRALAGRAVVVAARVDPGAPERVHVLARGRDEPDVQVAGGRVPGAGREQREVIPLQPSLACARRLVAELGQRGAVEALAAGEVGDADAHVVEDGATLDPGLPWRTHPGRAATARV